jgi:XRE family aerobic/anaerobic benzoate catabolism transcriptional regulator
MPKGFYFVPFPFFSMNYTPCLWTFRAIVPLSDENEGFSNVINQDEIIRAIGSKVRAARAEAGITRKQLAHKADVSERYLSQLESCDANVSVGILARVAGALNVDFGSLLPSTPGGALSSHLGFGVHAPLADLVRSMSLREQEGSATIIERYLHDRRRPLKGVALLGLRGAGKTTIGGIFAERHGLPFLSVTREIEARAGMNLNDLFNLGGPDAYRTLENEVVKALSGRNDRIVLETAGGLVSNKEALDVVLDSFKTVWLKASPDEHLQRVINQGDMRPVHGTPKALEHLKALLATREQEYARADSVLDTTDRTPEDCVHELEYIGGAAVGVF